MDILLIVGSILVILGIVGAIIPAMPGPILSFVGLILLFLSKGTETISITTLIILGGAMFLLVVIDYLGPILGARFSGASKMGIRGAIIGALLGMFFLPPLGVFVGALIGAIAGELYGGKNFEEALRAGTGVFLGSVFTIFLQIVYVLFVAIYFFIKIF